MEKVKGRERKGAGEEKGEEKGRKRKDRSGKQRKVEERIGKDRYCDREKNRAKGRRCDGGTGFRRGELTLLRRGWRCPRDAAVTGVWRGWLACVAQAASRLSNLVLSGFSK